MKIDKIILYKYRRLFLNNIERLEYTPIAPVQVIIGRNMCGKSSLLKELTPLPAEVKKEFKDGGYKEIHISHNGSNYILTSKIENNRVTHSFIKDNEELNDGRNKTIQLELVKTYFNLTPQIVDILLNKNKFTTMSPFERKKWFSDMSSIDYTYPISVYNKIKSRYRDIVGGIKLSTDNLVSTESKLNNTELIDKYIKDKEVLEQVKDHISSLYVLNNDSNTTLEETYNKFNSEISNMEKLLSIPLETSLTKNDVKTLIDNTKIKLEHTLKEIELTHKELDLIETTKNYGEEDKLKEEYNNINNKYIELTKDLYNNIHNDVKQNVIEDNLYKDYEVFTSLSAHLMENINNLTQYDYCKDISKDELTKLKSDQVAYSNKLIGLNKRLELITIDKDKMVNNSKDENNKATCPICSHNFILNYDPKLVEKYEKDIESLNNEISNISKENYKLIEYLANIEKRYLILDSIKSIIRSNPNLKYIWITMLSEVNINTISSEELQSLVNKYLLFMDKWKWIGTYRHTLEDIKNKLKFISDTKKMNISLEQSRVEILNKKLFELSTSSTIMKDIISKNEKYLKTLENINNAFYNLSKSITNYRISMEKLSIDLRNNYLMELVNIIKEDIKVIDNEISKFKSAKDLILNEKKKIEEYKGKEKVLKLLEKELSPSEGLIAKSINSFLNIFVEEMNEVISNIWTYDIELLPCDIDNENGYDLDYKFRVKVDGNEIIEDVSKLSSSGQEIVDLAYRLVFAKYMGLESIPLMLDEFGSSFDKSHRTKAYEVIDRILGSEYGQIFLICHFESLYGTLRNMDVNILDPNNIELGYVTEKNSKFKIN